MKETSSSFRQYKHEKQEKERIQALLSKCQDSLKKERYDHELLLKELQDTIKKLQKKERETAAILAASIDGVLTFCLNGTVLTANRALEDILGYSRGEMTGKHISKIFKDLKGRNLKVPSGEILHSVNRKKCIAREVTGIRKDYSHIPLEITFSKTELPAPLFHICIIRDIKERKTLKSKMVHQATHHAISGLPNRLLLLDRINQSILFAKRDQKMVGILFFNLDHFKFTNTTLGRNIGDLLLKAVVKRIKRIIRKSDTFGHLEGDEFAIILSAIEGDTDCIDILHKINTKLTQPFLIEGYEIHTSASVGISLYPHNGKTPSELLKNADIAMCRAKELGKSNFQFYSPAMNVRILERITMQAQLSRAIGNNEFCLHYQPIVKVSNGAIVAIEALLRWQHPKLGFVSPQDFIPLAEETGLILPIGDWVIETACKQNKAWQEIGFPPLQMSVNLSAYQLKQKDIFKTVLHILKKTGLEPHYLELELTESAVIELITDVLDTLINFTKAGISLSIDDFGTGYSSLTYLQKLPVGKLKIDRSFISHLDSNQDDRAIVLSILSMAHKMGLEVVAEGVETRKQFEFLKKNKCDMMQGYYFTRPLPPEDITQIFRKKNKIEISSFQKFMHQKFGEKDGNL